MPKNTPPRRVTLAASQGSPLRSASSAAPSAATFVAAAGAIDTASDSRHDGHPGRPSSAANVARHAPARVVARGSTADEAIAGLVRAVADRIVQVPVDRLKAFGRRSRTHSDSQIARIMGSFSAFGLMTPIVIDEEERILAGHARVEAARRLGYASLPAVVASHLSEDEKRAYVIADNRLAELADWDREILAIELQDLSAIDFGFDLDVIGFSIAEIDIVIGEAQPSTDTDDELPLPAPAGPAVTRLGDLWHLGRHRLICGNSLEAASYLALLSGEKARMVLTDPPYNVPIDGFVGGLGTVKHREFAMASGEMSEAQFTAFLTDALQRMRENTLEGGLIYAFMDWRHEFELLAAARAASLSDHNLCIWNKMSGGMGSHYRSQHELCRIFKAGTAPHLNTVELGRHGRNRSNVWDHPGLSSFGRGRDDALASHPTVKPVALLAEAIKDCTRRGDLVLDPFLGSGSTLIAAERTGRRAAGIELDPFYCDTIIRRFEAVTGVEAVHAASGLTFAALAMARSEDEEEGAGSLDDIDRVDEADRACHGDPTGVQQTSIDDEAPGVLRRANVANAESIPGSGATVILAKCPATTAVRYRERVRGAA